MAFRCYHHPDRDAAGTCCYCDRPMCVECLFTNKQGKPFCKREEECLDYQDGLLSPGEPVSPIVAYLIDERSLDVQLNRVSDILDELGGLKALIEDVEANQRSDGPPEDITGSPPFEADPRIPGFCACKLAEEAAALLGLISLRVDFIRKEQELSGGTAMLDKVKEVQGFLEQEAAPKIREHLAWTRPYADQDGSELLASMGPQDRKGEP